MGLFFHISPKSPQNPIKSSKNLPISAQNRFVTEIYVCHTSCRYPNYATYDIIISQICHIRHNPSPEICHIRHNSPFIMSHTTFSNLYYVIYDIIGFLRYVTYDIMAFKLCRIRHNPDWLFLLAELWTRIITKHLFL